MAEYLGKVTGIVSTEELSTLTGATGGTIVQSGDITWLKFKKDNKVILFADRNIRTNLSWNSLNSYGLVDGKTISINSKSYLCRLPNGENTSLSEWDEFIVGLVPDNSISNWSGIYTIAQEPYASDTNRCFCLGNSSVSSKGTSLKSTSSSLYGFRPVLVKLISNCINTINSKDLGSIAIWSNTPYIITGDTHSLIEKLDGTEIKNLTNQASGTSYVLDLTSQFESLPYGKHTVEIIDMDSDGFSNTVTITFNKIKEPIAKLPTSASLVDRANFAQKINEELSYQLFKLRNHLTYMGIEVLETDKISSLIDKVSTISPSLIPTWIIPSGFWFNASEGYETGTYSSGISYGDNMYIFGGNYYNENYSKKSFSYNFVKNTYSSIADMPTNRTYCRSVLVNNKIYVIGGYNGIAIDNNDVYDIDTNVWSSKLISPVKSYAQCLTSVNDKIYQVFGNSSNRHDCYDTVTDTWSSKTQPPGGTGRFFAKSISHGNNIYTIGGVIGGTDQTHFYCYDTVTDTWSAKLAISTWTRDFGMICVDDYIYVVIGSSGIIFRYDIKANTWVARFATLPFTTTFSDVNIGCHFHKGYLNLYFISAIKDTANTINSIINKCYIV